MFKIKTLIHTNCKEDIMTQKELLYVEDAIEHETNIIKILEDTKTKLSNQNLVSFIETNINTHTSIKENLLEKLEEKANE